MLTDDAIYMTDGYNNRVVKLDKDGGVIGVLGKAGKLPGEFNYCHHIAAWPQRRHLHQRDFELASSEVRPAIARLV